ncbi:MAG: hypothetical protein AAF320_01145 [Myxococcota bacterium]
MMDQARYVMPLSPLEKEMVEAIEPVLEIQGCELVRICVSGPPRNVQVEVFIENSDQNDPICVNKLQQLHPLVQDVLAVEFQQKLLKEEYGLQLSSPGFDRPLTRFQHFQEAIGKNVCVRFAQGTQRRSQTGVLLGVQEDGIVLKDLDELAARSLLLQWHEMQEVICLHAFSCLGAQKRLATKSSVAARRGKSCRK